MIEPEVSKMRSLIIFVASNGIVMKKIAVLIFVFALSLSGVQCQSLTEEIQEINQGEGQVTIHQEEGIDFLLQTQTEVNKRKGGVDGYRIQLYSGSGPKGKRQALDVKSKFLEEFPEGNISTTYNPPFWRVRVGNYRHKHEALPLLSELKELFPNCYVVKDGNVKMEKF